MKQLTFLGKIILISILLVLLGTSYLIYSLTISDKKSSEIPRWMETTLLEDSNILEGLTASPTQKPQVTPTPSVSNKISTDIISDTAPVGPKLLTTNQYIFANVNKANALPAEFVPSDLVSINSKNTTGPWKIRNDANGPLNEMIAAASKDGVNFIIPSSFRSYQEQVELFNRYVRLEQSGGLSYEKALEKVKMYSAEPGHSEHQLGTAIDCIAPNMSDFSQTDSNKQVWNWFAANAFKYGFVVSYPAGKESLTGYNAEPWHLRYVGVDFATKLQNLNYLSAANKVTLQSELMKVDL